MTDTTPGSSSPFAYARRARALRPSAVREILKVTAQPDVISFAGGLPAPELFPVEAVRAAAEAEANLDTTTLIRRALAALRAAVLESERLMTWLSPREHGRPH